MKFLKTSVFIPEYLGQICGMFQKLKKKWRVNTLQLWLIFLTFAVGGSLAGRSTEWFLDLANIHRSAAGIVLYIIVVTLLWPISVLLISIPLGQFSFFKKYVTNIISRFGGKKHVVLNADKAEEIIVNIAIFASGAGTNAAKIIGDLPGILSQKKDTNISVHVALILTDNPAAGVLKIAAQHEIPSEIILLKGKSPTEISEAYLSFLKKYNIDLIVLAGYLKMIPAAVIHAYPEKIINIHPALLPAYGGAGMYGARVHEAIIAAGETQSGISIHYVDEIYDHGKIIFQASCDIDGADNAASLAKKIHQLEHAHFSDVIANVIYSQKSR